VEPNLAHFSGIVPCGLPQFGVTSLAALGISATMDDADVALRAAWEEVFETDADGKHSHIARKVSLT
jgi:lipoyl(octanoyl) transferase